MTHGIDEEGPYIRAVPEWRDDPARRAAAERWLDEQINGLEAATALAEQAAKALPPMIFNSSLGLETIIRRATELQRRAARDLREALEGAKRSRSSETYIGNMAAFGEGWTEPS